MARPEKLSAEAIEKHIAGTPWTLAGGKLHRELKFGGFVEAFAFMTQIALWAEKLDHHPEWSNVYDRVTIDLMTHDAGGVTALDLELAGRIDAAAGPNVP